MKKYFLVIGIVIIAVAGIVVAYLATRPSGTEQNQVTQPQPATPTGQAPAPSVLGVAMSKNISAIGEPLNPATVFSPTTTNIYAVLSLKGVSRTTQLAYVRKYNGKYVDSKVSHPPKDDTKTFYFKWSLKTGETRKIGAYTLTFYINGARSLSTSYTVK